MADLSSEFSDTDRLVELARQGDLSATKELFSRHRARLKRMIAIYLDPRLAPRVDPSDVLQETLANAARRLPNFPRDRPGGFYPWLRQIARDRLVDVHRRHIRSEKRSIEREVRQGVCVPPSSAMRLADQLVSNATSPSEHYARLERRELISAALDRISESYREILLMRFVEQLSPREIADLLEISESAVKSKLWRALEKLQNLIDPQQGAIE